LRRHWILALVLMLVLVLMLLLVRRTGHSVLGSSIC
jgi:hypothetical protein